MKYKLLIKPEFSNHKVTCACGKCPSSVYIDDHSKELFKKMMKWSEDEFISLIDVFSYSLR